MVDTPIPTCPTCQLPLKGSGIRSVGSFREGERLDDPSHGRWDNFECPQCGKGYRVNTETGELQELR